jgi:hypothetical protein
MGTDFALLVVALASFASLVMAWFALPHESAQVKRVREAARDGVPQVMPAH